MIKEMNQEKMTRSEELKKNKLDNKEGYEKMIEAVNENEAINKEALMQELIECKRMLFDKSNEMIMARAHILTDLIGKVDQESKEYDVILSDILKTLKVEEEHG